MKKIFALMIMFCLVLCASSSLAAQLIFKDDYEHFVSQEVSGGTFTLPTPQDLGIQNPAGATGFYGWMFASGDRLYHQPGETITINSNYMQFDGYWTTEKTAYITYKPGTGIGTEKVFPAEIGSIATLTYESICGFTSSNGSAFRIWHVTGDCKEYVYEYGPDLGWLVGRAIADNEYWLLDPEKEINVLGKSITVTALWGDETGPQDSDDNGGNTEPSAPQYSVNVIDSAYGKISVSKTKANQGEKVTITVTPDEGYGLSELNVSYSDGSQQVTVNNKSFTMPDSDVNVQATFVPRNQVIFNANGGACAVASATVNAENKLDELPEATREGYLFIGWFDDDEGGNPITKEMEFEQTQTTVYAQWCDAKHTTDPDKNDFNADIDMEDSDILNLLIDDDDKEKRKNILVYLTVEKEKEEDVPSDDKTAIVNKAGEDKIAAYLDIELFKQIGDDPPEKISNTGGKVHIKLMLEDALIPENAAKDSFYIIYYHDREAKRIDASFNVATKELTFDADKFSTYSLVYKTRTDENVTTSSLPKTGDDSMVALWSVMLALSAIAAAAVAKKRRAE